MTILVSVWVIMQMLATGCVSQDDALQSGDKGMKWRGIKAGLNSTINPSSSTDKHNSNVPIVSCTCLKIAGLWQAKWLNGLETVTIYTYRLKYMGKTVRCPWDRCLGCL